MTDKISEKDKKDWENFISGKEKVPDKDLKTLNKKFFKIKTIDLHGFSIEQAHNVVEEFIYKSYEEKVNKIIVVTGKGLHSQTEKNPYVSKDLSILKYSVPEYIENNKNLMNIIHEIKDANFEDGGSGAFYIFLKKNKSTK